MKKVMLIILDGFGEAVPNPGNAIAAADMPFFQKLRNEKPLAFLKTDGSASGLPDGQTGASEPGHFVIGAGRVVWQPLEEINRAFNGNEIMKRKEFSKFIKKAKSGKKVHLMGMVSDGGVHSHIEHLFDLLDILNKEGVKDVHLHAFADGRDVHEKSIKGYLDQVVEKGKCKIASLVGRYYAMDRDNNYDRTKIAYDLLTKGKGEDISFADLDKNIYINAETDYYLPAFKFEDFETISEDDLVLFFNFRSDRAQQITTAFCKSSFSEFKRDVYFSKNKEQFVVFGPYHLGDAQNIFPPANIKNSLGEWWAKHNVKQLRIAETEKFAHVTFFFNSQIKEPYVGEDRILVNSPKVASYDKKPEMSAKEVTDKVCIEISKNKYDAIVLNFANADLVGHAGNIEASKKAVEFLDKCLEKVVPLAKKHEYSIIITADHGNSDKMLYEDGETCPSHSDNVVPCIFITDKKITNLKSRIKGNKNGIKYHGELADIAPTMLDLMELEVPGEMTGESFIE